MASRMIIPGLFESPVRILRATLPDDGSHCKLLVLLDVFIPLHSNTQYNIGSAAQDSAIFTHFIMDTVHKDKWINGIQRAGLPEPAPLGIP